MRQAHALRLANLAEALRPWPGRKPDSRLQAIVERLGELAHYDEEYLKVAEMHAHLARLGYRSLPDGYASNALGRLAERGLVVTVVHGRFRINDMHPELVALLFKLLDAEVASMGARDQVLRDAETRSRRMAGRR